MALLLVLALQDFQGLLSDDIEVRERAFEELVRMGPKGLPAIRAAKAEGDLKLLLEKAARRIERAVRLAARVPEPRRVTLEAKDRPLKEVLAELGRLGGQPIDDSEAPEGRVTVSLDKELFWEALDRVCRARKGACWKIQGGVRVVAGEPRPVVVQGDIALWAESGSGLGLLVNGAAIEGRAPDLVLSRAEGVSGLGTIRPYLCEPQRVTRSFQLNLHCVGPALDDLARVKGEATLEYVLSSRVVASLTLEQLRRDSVVREGLRFSSHYELGAEGLTPWQLRAATEDSERLVRAEVWITNGQGTASRATTMRGPGVWAWSLREMDPVSFEVREPDDVERVVIPFEFKDIPVMYFDK